MKTIFFMFRIFIFILLILTTVQINFGQVKSKIKSVPNYPSLTIQANEMAQAFLNEDYETFSNYMYPKLFEFLGTKEKFIEFTKNSINDMKSTGASFEKYKVVKTLQTLRSNKQIFGVLQTEMIMNMPPKKVNIIGSVVGVSNDYGKNWKFIRITSADDLKQFFPKLSNKLKVLPDTISE